MLRTGQSGPEAAFIARVSVDFPNVLANTIGTVAGVSVPGVAPGDTVFVSCSDTNLNAGLAPMQTTLITAANTLTLALGNLTTGALNPPACNFDVLVLKRTNIGAG